jgi:hypothetical protein
VRFVSQSSIDLLDPLSDLMLETALDSPPSRGLNRPMHRG